MRARYARVSSTGERSRAAMRRLASTIESFVRSSSGLVSRAMVRLAASTAVAAAPARRSRRVVEFLIFMETSIGGDGAFRGPVAQLGDLLGHHHGQRPRGRQLA